MVMALPKKWSTSSPEISPICSTQTFNSQLHQMFTALSSECSQAKQNKAQQNKTKQKNKKNKDILGKNHDLAVGCGFPRMIMMNGKQRSWIVKNSHDQTRESRNTGYDNPKFEELTGAPGLVSTLSLRSMLVTNNRQNCALCESMWKGPWERHGIENAEARTLGCARFPPEPPCTDVERPASAMRP